MDTIFIDNLTYTGIHGVYKKEHHIPQRFNISIMMDVDTTLSSHTDDVEDTVDYKHIQESIKEIIEGRHYNLIEKIAQIIANKILENSQVTECTVTIKKLDAFDIGTPGVTIRRKQSSSLLSCNPSTISNLISELKERGVCVIPLLSHELCSKIKSETDAFPFIQAEEFYPTSNCRQNFTYFYDYPKDNLVWKVAHELEQLLNHVSKNEGSLIFETPLSFTEMAAHHYEITEVGIDPQRDESRYRNIIAICVIEGDGEFYTTTEKINGVEKIIQAKAGDVIFMRAPGFMNSDIRPIHGVRNIISPRLSVTFRQEQA